ncbi:MAG: OFA family MFS transporter, partial [Verrucomicrobiota bacterium]
MSFLDKQHTVAQPNFNRWLVPPAALAIHLSIGMAYGFSVFWLPLSKAIGITVAAPSDWKIKTLGWTYTLFFVLLGSSAAIFGGWLERNGPRKAGVAAACCWGGGFMVAALGVYLHQIWLLWLGAGVIGGCGLGLGYISPVSTLIKWFPDKRGMATGMAIMGFGGGAMIGAPLADKLMKFYATPTSVGVWETFVTMGLIYFVAMMCGAFTYRIPPAGWRPHGWSGPVSKVNAMMTQGHVHVNTVHRTPQFWMLWVVLCMNVSAGIG